MPVISAGAPPTAPLTPRRRRLRLVPLGIGAVAMAWGLWTGLARLGVPLPGGIPPGAELHGALMISGFLGTLICLERAVAIGRPWAYAAPALAATGALALLAGLPQDAAFVFAAAGIALVAASAIVVARQPALFSVVLATAAACWAAGTLLWLAGRAMPEVAGWWLVFLVLTIAAERLELSRLGSPPPWSRFAFAAAAALLLVGSARGELAEGRAPVMAAGLIACAAWLLKYDIARRTIRLAGQPRFSAAAILAGHVWLAVAGVVLLAAPPAAAPLAYDAAVHAIAIGCILSMVLGHAPIILPAVTGLRLSFIPLAYAPLALLEASAALRVGADLIGAIELRAASGPLTVLALAGYAAVLGLATRRERRAAAAGQPPRKAPRTAARSSAAS
jgi:hypothetical protein